MMETSTSVNKLNCGQSKQQEMLTNELDMAEIVFYESIKAQLDELERNPSEETISKIMSYSRTR